MLFQSRSVYYRNTSIGAKGIRNEALNGQTFLDGGPDFETEETSWKLKRNVAVQNLLDMR